ncbi:hypothetical protein [Methylobacterium radiotolerans]|uniref:hypothetical protein n=1 Tax=Methylobacterium radiotolerans TaxID=31998 RepID=UPI000D5C69DA|nr:MULTISPECIES: hypothetical protein [Methylobacterium]MDE3749438.1 hypothetical protein [Methylobacterium radiotolerans]PVY97889.1 hypothetical protein C7388_112142 [Methylobacterium organophilum]
MNVDQPPFGHLELVSPAPHPIRAAFGNLAISSPGADDIFPAEPLPSASEALGRMESSLAILDAIGEAALTAVHHLERATIAGAGQRADMGRLEDVAAKLDAVARRAEAARARVSDKLAGAR